MLFLRRLKQATFSSDQAFHAVEAAATHYLDAHRALLGPARRPGARAALAAARRRRRNPDDLTVHHPELPPWLCCCSGGTICAWPSPNLHEQEAYALRRQVPTLVEGLFIGQSCHLVEEPPMAALPKIPDMPMELMASDGGSRRRRLCGRRLRERPAGGAERRLPEEAYSPGNRWQR